MLDLQPGRETGRGRGGGGGGEAEGAALAQPSQPSGSMTRFAARTKLFCPGRAADNAGRGGAWRGVALRAHHIGTLARGNTPIPATQQHRG